ncbi:MAG: prolipoprotein diacylglyceryl transferase [Candidatus Woykebacteria bacterium]
MLPILLKIGPITVYSFGFFLILAYFAATFILWREGKRQGYNEERLLDLSVISLVAALVGGRLYYVILNWPLFADEPLSSLSFWQGGFAYHGSLIAVLLVSIYFILRWKWTFFQIADIGAISASAALTLGKIGSFLAGVDFGASSSLPWAVRLPGLVGARHPVQLYEAGAYFIIFLVLYFLYFKYLASKNMRSGRVFFIFLVATSIIRAILEFYRADPHTLLGVPTATIVSVLIAAASLIAIYYFQIRDARSDLKGFLEIFFGINTRFLKRIKF